MPTAQFSIGIDLGTTNCALSWLRLPGGQTEVFAIPQWETPSTSAESATLPSFLLLPSEAGSDPAAWKCGRLARRQATDTPGRVAHSAKSWLAHHAVDRDAPILPWGSDDIPAAQKLSPVAASARLLAHLRTAWDAKFPSAPFDEQLVTVTVPASFDPVAQRITLEAARRAGFPTGTKLLEEPQAAFYRWLESRPPEMPVPGLEATGSGHVLVVDIGGGTSDFSLFEVSQTGGQPTPRIRRIAVSDHILLGGDNMDLAIAHELEVRMVGTGQRLPSQSWSDLVARCRDLKEQAFSSNENTPLSVSLPGRGSNLFAQARSVTVERPEIERLVLDGFFPECPADVLPDETRSGLKEWGLPYASDSAITRHLAAFLTGRPPVSAILFNGGALQPAILRTRLRQLVARWQSSSESAILENPEPDLAVARGAAKFGALAARSSARIESGSARAIYLEAVSHDSSPSGPTLVCILPRNAAPGEEFSIASLGLEVRVNQPVRFQPFASTRHAKDRAGTTVAHRDADFRRLPPLQTTISLEGHPDTESLPVTLSARLSELGLLEVSCVSADPAHPHEWPLAFNLRPHESDRPSTLSTTVPTDPGVPPESLETARAFLEKRFLAPLHPRDKCAPTPIFKNLEQIFKLPKAEWNYALLRALWPSVYACFPARASSPEHEETWLILAGYLLRPGIGGELDARRMDELWRVRVAGPAHPGKRIRLQENILWRRVAPGLDRDRQHTLLDPELPTLLGKKNPAPDLVRLAGSLERIDIATRSSLAEALLRGVRELADTGGHCTDHFAALGQILSRTPLYAGPEAVVPSSLVERAFQELSDLDWAAPPFLEAQTLFLRAARLVNDRSLDLARPFRERIASRLEKAGVSPAKVARLRQFVPVESAEQSRFFGEALPPGLLLSASSE